MSDTGHDNWNGFTSGTSEGAWSRVDSGLMKYERASPQTYGPPTSDAWRESSIWKACPCCGRDCLGFDSLDEHMRAKHSVAERMEAAMFFRGGDARSRNAQDEAEQFGACPHCTLPIRRGQTVTVDGTAHSGCVP